jgi:hypothetical protein
MNLPNGTFALWRVKPDSKWMAKAIAFFTGKPVNHAAAIHGGDTWEEDVGGARQTAGIRKADEYWAPDVPFSPEESARGLVFLQVTTGMGIRRPWPYNWLLTGVKAIIYPTRWFWNWIGWVPFSSQFYGVNCSVYCDLYAHYAGRDIRPKWLEHLSAPGDLRELPGYHQVIEVLV